MTPTKMLLGRLMRIALAAMGLALLSGCEENTRLDHSLDAIPADTMALMQEKGTTTDAPVLIRSYKQEAEFEIWKRKPDGRYVYLKTYPMCRWSGQLGPKTREGDRQVPEGFYSITPGALNPNSSYYLSFNIGYPNAYDRAHGATGGHIMVHGICSSAGCFSMTNEQIGEIYALAREAFNGGQHAIQMQSYPFRMTPKNLAKHRADPNMAFWRNLKEGSDNFEVTKQEPVVGVCAKHYVFNAQPVSGRLEASDPCPALREDPDVKADVAVKEKRDEAAVAELVNKGEKAVQLVYIDGGQHPAFRGKYADTSRPDALVTGPTEIVMDDQPLKSPKAAKTMLANDARSKAKLARMLARAPVDIAPTSSVAAAPPPSATATAEEPVYKRLLGFAATTPQADAAAATTVVPATPVAPVQAEASLYSRLLGLGGAAPPAQAAPVAAAVAADAEVRSPDDKSASAGKSKPERRVSSAASKPLAKAKHKAPHAKDDVAKIIGGASPTIESSFQALAPAER